MILFKKYYKEANDDIETNRALISDIFEKAEKNKKTVPFRSAYRIASCAAAVFAVCAILYIYPHMDIKHNMSGAEQGLESEKIRASVNGNSVSEGAENADVPSTETAVSPDKDVEVRTAPTKDTQKPNTDTANAAAVNDLNSGAAVVGAEKLNAAADGDVNGEKAVTSKNGETKRRAGAAETRAAAESTEGARAETAKAEDEVGGGVSALSEQKSVTGSAETAAEVSGTSEAYSVGGASAVMKRRAEDDEFIVWNSRMYFDYLGTDVFKKIKLPGDMKNTTPDEFRVRLTADGIPYEDEAQLTFEASESRMLMFYVSKENSAHLFDGGAYKTKTVNGMTVYYNSGEGVCGGYVYNGNAGFVFYSSGMTDNELETAIASLK